MTSTLEYQNFENCRLLCVPDCIFFLTHLKHLSLYGNKIRLLPEKFYLSFPHLKWLDLRFNHLSHISPSISRLSSVENLLLGHNNISKLCLEIGGLKNLVGLNVEGNPILFPHEDIVRRGPSFIIYYLKRCYALRNDSKSSSLGDKQVRLLLNNPENEQNVEINKSVRGLHRSGTLGFRQILDLVEDHNIYVDVLASEIGCKEIHSQDRNNNFVSCLHCSLDFNKFKSPIRSANAFHSKKMTSFQSQRQTSACKAVSKILSDECAQKCATVEIIRRKKLPDKKRQDSALQKLKNIEAADKWKMNYRNKQKLISSLYQTKLSEEISAESRERIRMAPFGINSEIMPIISASELQKLKMSSRPAILPDPPPRPLSCNLVIQLEKERARKDKILIGEIAEQLELLNAKMDNPCLSKSTTDAQVDLFSALNLQLRLRKRYDVLTQLNTSTDPIVFRH